MSENQAAGRGKKSRREQWKERLRGSTQPDWLQLFSRGRPRQSSRTPSPIPSGGKADDTQATAGASASELEISVKHEAKRAAATNGTIPVIKLDDKADDNQDAELNATMDGSQDQGNENTDLDAADNMWTIAEVRLRQDKQKNKLLDRYYDILKSKLKEDLEPAGTLERRKQITAFIESESKHFHDTSKSGEFASVFKKAADCILKAEKVISAAVQPCLPASIACAGMMLVLSVSSSLQLHTTDANT